jgi:isocitrate dehydrogenase
VLTAAVDAGKRIGSIFKEPTITPSALQVKEFGLSQALKSPNGMMRKGWNGITISRDTIHIDGVKLGFDRPVLFERHAVGGEYGAGWKQVGKGRLITQFLPEDGSPPQVVDDRLLDNENNVAVTYHNPLDNVKDLSHHFFTRCLAQKVIPYVVTKKTVFKWQEPFWIAMKEVFDEHYKQQYIDADLLPGGELQHLISDAATMQIIRWTGGGFGMAAHNYDGDMLTDEVAQVHRSPGFITSNLVGVNDDGTAIKEFEASHGTVADLWHMHNQGEETSMNPLGMVEAVIGAMMHSAHLAGPEKEAEFENYCTKLREALHNTFRYGQGTRDMAGPEGLTTEEFINKVAWRLGRYIAAQEGDTLPEDMLLTAPKKIAVHEDSNVDKDALQELFATYDHGNKGSITVNELEEMLVKIGVAPLKDIGKRSSASSDKEKE